MIFACISSVILCHNVFVDPKNLKIGIINGEVKEFNKICVKEHQDCNFNLSCRYINEISDDYGYKKFYANFDEAYNEAKKGNLIGIGFPLLR
jgi:hypothetical protein